MNQELTITMEEQEYAKMARADDSMWWFGALHRNARYLLRRFHSNTPADVLDAGCGTGGLLKFLRSRESLHRYQGLELYEPASRIAASRAGCKVVTGSVHELPFAEASFDAILSTFVLSQKGVDIDRAVTESLRCLRPGGTLIVLDAATPWLKSYHDEHVGVVRRFRRHDLCKLLCSHTFSVSYCSYWSTFLFPLVVARRKVFCSEQSESDVKDYGYVADAVFGSIMTAERAFLRAGCTFPFGVGIMAVGVKPRGN